MMKLIGLVILFFMSVVGCSFGLNTTVKKANVQAIDDRSLIRLATFEYLITNRLATTSVATIYVDDSRSQYTALTSRLTNSNLKIGRISRDLAERDILVFMGGIDVDGSHARAVAGLHNWSDMLFKFDLERNNGWTVKTVVGPIIVDRFK
jgi:hypothetical protein